MRRMERELKSERRMWNTSTDSETRGFRTKRPKIMQTVLNMERIDRTEMNLRSSMARGDEIMQKILFVKKEHRNRILTVTTVMKRRFWKRETLGNRKSKISMRRFTAVDKGEREYR